MSVHLIFCLRRHPSLTLPEFLSYWRDNHAPLVRARAAALHIARYEQSRPVPGWPAQPVADLRNAPEPYDGIASLWFDSVEEFYAGGSTPEGRRAARELLEDERRFINLDRSPIWLAEDHLLVGGPR
jgi:uncharacterized protein (TIGR02118 family)